MTRSNSCPVVTFLSPYSEVSRSALEFRPFYLPLASAVSYGLTSLFILRQSDGASLRISMDSQTQEKGRCSLAAEALRSWGRLRLRARGLSMLPTLWPGDFLTIQSRSAEQIEPGEIVLYMREGRFFVHRVKSKSVVGDGTFLIVRGIACPTTIRRFEAVKCWGNRRGSARRFCLFPARKLSPFRKTVAYLFCHWNLFRQVGLRLWTRRQQGDAQILTAFVEAAS